jgi:hypothetical protein
VTRCDHGDVLTCRKPWVFTSQFSPKPILGVLLVYLSGYVIAYNVG